MIKKYLLLIFSFFSIFWKIIPENIRVKIFLFIFILESRGNKEKALKQLFLIKDKLDYVINERALSYGQGIHPKHSLTRYHYFFVDNIKNGEKVLDIGCGYGAVSNTIAQKKNMSTILGIDYDCKKLKEASKKYKSKNLKFIKLDATKKIPYGKWDIIILSNVLEHIQNRVIFLKKIVKNSKCKKILIRVPLFERSWEIPMRKKLKINYYSDNDHKIEHTIKKFSQEIKLSGLIITETHTIWGEIWAVCVTK